MFRVANHYVASRKIRLFAIEWLVLAAAALGATLLTAWPGPTAGSAGWTMWPLLRTAVVATAAIGVALYLGDLYDLRVARHDGPLASRLLRALGGAALLLALISAANVVAFPKGALLAALGGATLAAALIRSQLERVTGVLGGREPIVILGDGAEARKIGRDVGSDGDAGVEVVGYLSDSHQGIAATLRERGVRTLVVATHDRRQALPIGELLSARMMGVEVLDAVRFAERTLRRIPVGSLRPSDVIFGGPLVVRKLDAFFCRALHVVTSGLILLLCAPLLLVVAVAIKLDSRGPVFYRQARVGLRGKIFTLYKLRTMRADAEQHGAQWARNNDDRVTSIGKLLRKTRLDEIPQLINVFRGDMALVGPRPERPEFVGKLKEVIPFYGLREAVPPGLSGWAQIKFAYASNVEEQREKLEYDLYYVRHRSFWLDVVILLSTIKVVLLGRGAR